MTGNRVPTLDELAFTGRNREYGAYRLRKRYSRYLFVSVMVGVAFLMVLVAAAWSYYFFRPVPAYVADLMYEISYYPMMPPPDEESADLANAYAKLPPEPDIAPVVRDTIVPEKPPEPEKQEERPEDPEVHTDSAATPGGSGMGTGVGDDRGLATSVDVYPRYPGGDEMRLNYLRRNVRYPDAALKGQVQGVVMVVFVVETDGSITQVDVARPIGGGCDEEAIRVTKAMPRWEPGKRNGLAVRVMVRMPIVFRIPGKPMK